MRNPLKFAALGILIAGASRADAQLVQTRDIAFCGVIKLRSCAALHLTNTKVASGTVVTFGVANLQGSGFPGEGTTWSSFRDIQLTDFTASGNAYNFLAGFDLTGPFGTGGGYGTESLVGGATGAFLSSNTSAFIKGSSSGGGKVQMKMSYGTVPSVGSPKTFYGIGGCTAGSYTNVFGDTFTSDTYTCVSSAPSADVVFGFFTNAPSVNLKDFDTIFAKSVGFNLTGVYKEQSCYLGDEHEANLAGAIADGDPDLAALYADRLAQCTKLSDVTQSFAPEPGSVALLASGLAGLLGLGMTRRRA